MLNKKILLFAALLILLAGVVSANEVSDDVTADSADAMEVTQDMPTPQETIGSQTEVETNRENNIENKTIEKTLTKQYTTDYKQADDTTEVNSYTKLKEQVDKYNIIKRLVFLPYLCCLEIIMQQKLLHGLILKKTPS